MRLVLAHFLGLGVGYGIAWLTIWFFTMRKDADQIIVDVWWLENDQRWLDLAPVLRKERGLPTPKDAEVGAAPIGEDTEARTRSRVATVPASANPQDFCTRCERPMMFGEYFGLCADCEMGQ